MATMAVVFLSTRGDIVLMLAPCSSRGGEQIRLDWAAARLYFDRKLVIIQYISGDSGPSHAGNVHWKCYIDQQGERNYPFC